MKHKTTYKIIFEIIVMLFWVSILNRSDSYYTPYLVTSILAFVCFYVNQKRKEKLQKIEKKITSIVAMFFSLIVVLANYSIILYSNYPNYGSKYYFFSKIILLILLLNGGYFTAWNILYCLGKKTLHLTNKKTCKISPTFISCIFFLVFSTINVGIMITCKYPGNLTYDSIVQIDQIMSGIYTNHHPFYHTMIIKLFISIGMNLFGNMNAAVATYHVFQIVFMAICFTTSIYTLSELHISLNVIIIICIGYIIMPFHIMYSFTMWKDVLFGGFVLLFLVFTFRILKNMNKFKLGDYIIFLFSSFGICLLRSNGLFAFGLSFLCFEILFHKTQKKICYIFIGIIIITFSMKHIVLKNLNVAQPDIVEALSIPLQQLSNVIVEYNDFNDVEKELLNNIIDIDKVPSTYVPNISDPIKNLIRTKGNQNYIVKNKTKYLRLYIVTGLKHPISYIKAWIEQTKGFWNAGYSHWRWEDVVCENEYEIQRIVFSKTLNKCLDEYLWFFSNNELLQLFLCIGFYVWIDIFLFFNSILRKNSIGVFMTIPMLAIIFSLIISTPVSGKFRYAYGIFCGLPFLIHIVLIDEENHLSHSDF